MGKTTSKRPDLVGKKIMDRAKIVDLAGIEVRVWRGLGKVVDRSTICGSTILHRSMRDGRTPVNVQRMHCSVRLRSASLLENTSQYDCFELARFHDVNQNSSWLGTADSVRCHSVFVCSFDLFHYTSFVTD